MKPGERVVILKRLARELAKQDRHEINLTLRQFGAEILARHQDIDDYRYALGVLEDMSSDMLLELHEFLLSERPGQTNLRPVTPSLWTEGRFRLFLSHVHTIKEYVAEVKNGLSTFGIDAFVAHEDIKPTKEWRDEIESALHTCDAMAAFLTSDFHSSPWTDQELGYALQRGILIVPVRMGVDPYGFVGKFQGMAGAERNAKEVTIELYRLLREHKLTASRITEGLIRNLERSDSFAEAKDHMSRLKAAKGWNPQLVERLEASLASNSEVSGAYGVSAAIKSIAESYRTKAVQA